MTWFTLFLLAAAGFGIACLLLQVALTIRHRTLSKPALADLKSAPGLSILKPLCGVDDDLEKNLETFARIDYPDDALEVVLGVENVKDPAHAVAMAAVAKWPRRFRLVEQVGRPGHNPKVNQLVTLARAARFDILVVSDSNTRVPPGYAQEIVAAMQDPRVGCVSHPIVGVGGERLGSVLDNFHLASSIGGGMIGSQLMPGKTLVVGKSMALRRADLQSLGGFEAACDVLAEDYVIGGWVQGKLKKRVFLARSPVENVSQRKRVGDFFQRYRRWSVIHRTSISLPVYLAQGLLNPAPFAFLALILAPSQLTLAAAAGVLLAKILLDIAHVALLRPQPVSAREFGLLLALGPLKDGLLFIAWLNGFVERHVRWRGKKLRVTKGSRLLASDSPMGEATPALQAELAEEERQRLSA